MFAEPGIYTFMGYLMLFHELGLDYTLSTYASEGGNFGSFVSFDMAKKLNAKMYAEAKRSLELESIRGGLAGVVVGEVLTCTDHPDSDHLHLTTVDVGGEAPLQIVCGAPNCRQGLKVLCATVGAVLYPNGGEEEFKIKRSKIRGVESLGMLCAEDELGIGASHEASWSCRPTRKSASRPGST